MRASLILIIALVAAFLAVASAETAINKLKAKVEAAPAAAATTPSAPCAKDPPKGPSPPKQYLDQRLPFTVDDYHLPPGGFDPVDLPDKEVDTAARKILREIQKAEKEAAERGETPKKADDNAAIPVEDHKYMKRLLLDADILVRAAGRMLSENGPIKESQVRKISKRVAASAVRKARRGLRRRGRGRKSRRRGGRRGRKSRRRGGKRSRRSRRRGGKRSRRSRRRRSRRGGKRSRRSRKRKSKAKRKVKAKKPAPAPQA